MSRRPNKRSRSSSAAGKTAPWRTVQVCPHCSHPLGLPAVPTVSVQTAEALALQALAGVPALSAADLAALQGIHYDLALDRLARAAQHRLALRQQQPRAQHGGYQLAYAANGPWLALYTALEPLRTPWLT